MRTMILFLALALLCSCRASKEVRLDTSAASDSTARSDLHRSIVTIDSVFRSTSFDFDSLEVRVERPSSCADVPEVIVIKAVKGRVVDRRRLYRDSVEAYNRLDSVAWRQSAATACGEHTAATAVFSPPGSGAIAALAAAVCAALLLIYYFFRKV